MPDSKQIELTELTLDVDASSMLPAISAAVGEAWLLYGDLVSDDDLVTIFRDCTSVVSERAEARLVLTFDHEKFSRRCAILAGDRQAEAFFDMVGALHAALVGANPTTALVGALNALLVDENTPPTQKVNIGPLDV